MKQPEYREGPEVARKFEDALKRVFQTPKLPTEEKPKETASQETERKSDRD